MTRAQQETAYAAYKLSGFSEREALRLLRKAAAEGWLR